MRRNFSWSTLLGVALALTVGAGVSFGAETGLKVGEKAPSFSLKDQNGKARTLEELLKKGPVAVVFHRSASW